MSIPVQEFVEEISKRGLARQNRFEVQIPKVDFYPGGNDRTLSLLCQSASIPGATIAVKKQQLFGPAHIRPANINYGETLSVSFLCDKDMWVKRIFDLWMHRVIGWSTFTVGYKSDYARDVIINQLDDSGEVTYSVTLVDAFPVSMGAMALNQSALDRFHLLPITFTYRYWETALITNSAALDVFVEGPQEQTKPWGPRIPATDTYDPYNIPGFTASLPPGSDVPGGRTSDLPAAA